MRGPLAGIKVVEIAGIGPAPCAGMMLADMGADVILVERKSANAKRDGVPPDQTKQMFFNRGKKSIAVDLKKPAGVELVLKLVEHADVLTEGFRPGVMERLGLGPEVCLKRNSKLVYGRMTGWGQSGPLSHAAGHDANYIAVSGALWYGGRQNQPPISPITLTGDVGGGTMMLLWGVICALLNVQRGGDGQVVDAAITDGSAYISSLLWTLRNSGQLSDRLGQGWGDGAAPWNDTYECADGKFITICSLEPPFYAELLKRLRLEENPLFSDQWNSKKWPAAKTHLARLFKTKTRDRWSELLEGSDICFGPVLNFNEAPKHPHNVARKTFLEIDGITQPAPAPKLSLYQPKVGVPPLAGEHAEEILRNVGMNDEMIAELKEAGAV